MTAKQLAKMMIDGDLDYQPENDAHYVATSYIQLHGLVMRHFNSLPVDAMKEFKALLCEDRAKT